MSRFLHTRYTGLKAYVPGEQPKGERLIKLNTNESPFPPSMSVKEAMAAAAMGAHLYCDPECRLLREKAAQCYGVGLENVLAFNGSDEVLSFAFMAFGEKGVAYPSVSYGFYSVFAALYGLDAKVVPLDAQMGINPGDYEGLNRLIVLANPNAPTGRALSVEEIEGILQTNPEAVVVIDEAYVDFGADTVIPLTKVYDNLLVTRTFSKSHSLAGARLGFGIASAALIEDLNLIRCSTNPYNVNSMTQAAGVAAFDENEVSMNRCRAVAAVRDQTAERLKELGFEMPPSLANFLFIRHASVGGQRLYAGLRERGILVRHFATPGLKDYIRVSIGTEGQMEAMVRATEEILQEEAYAQSER